MNPCGTSPRTFTLRTMAARIGEVGEPWSGMDARRCSLREATAKLRTMLTDAGWSEALLGVDAPAGVAKAGTAQREPGDDEEGRTKTEATKTEA